MLSYERFENNIKIHDKYNIKDIKINKSTTYNGNLDLLNGTALPGEEVPVPPLAAAVVGTSNTSTPLPSNLDFLNLWTDIDSQEAYLKTKPTCYLILGKPGLGSYTLGENLSKKLDCMHLSPRNVILDEIEQKSPTGRCLDFNMRHNKICKFDLILAIMKAKISSQVIKHRGYVISGLPFVTSSKKEKYFLNTMYTEESLNIVDDLLYDLIWNLKKKKRKQKTQSVSHSSLSSDVDRGEEEEEEIEEEDQPEIESEEEAEQLVELPKYMLDTCHDIVLYDKISFTTKKGILLGQIQELFKLKSDIIIHITSPDTDTVTKRTRKFFNYINNVNTFHSFIINADLEVRWPNKYSMIEYSKPYATHVFNPKYNCKQPINFKHNSVNQLCNYKNNIHPFLEEKLKDFDSKHILKLDGRTSVHEMLHYIVGKLLLLPIKPVLIPKPLYLDEPPEDLDEFWATMKEFNAIKSGVLNFNRYASLWYNRCPVELQKRRSIQGKTKLAVSLFNRIFLLSSLDSMVSFCNNPRPYLKVKYLEPTCRVIIIGTKSSGKTMIAKCLSWLFDTNITSYNNFLNTEKQRKSDRFAKTILSEIIATIEDARYIKWQSTEMERTSHLNNWFTSALNTLENYIPLLEKRLKGNKGEEELTEVDNYLTEAELKYMNKLKLQLTFLPILDDLQLCKDAALDRNLLNYAPIELATETLRPNLPILGDKDVTEAVSAYIIANDIQKDIEPTTEELMNEMAQMLLSNDKESLERNQKYGQFIIDGFPSDPEYWGYLEKFKVLPDYVIALVENKEINVELLNAYFVIDKSHKEYQERYILSNDPLVQIKKRYTSPTSLSNTALDIQIIVHDLLNNVYKLIVEEQDNENDTTAANVASFNEAIEKFREEYESVQLKLEENTKAVILVEIDTKSDIEVLDEVLLKLRQSYYLFCTPSEDVEFEDKEDDSSVIQDLSTYNDPNYLGETNIYCPIAYYDYAVLWEGKTEFCTQFDNKSYVFSKEECQEVFQKDVTKYLSFNKPFKSLPPLRICVIGCIGSGKTTLCKQLAKELGLMHIDFAEFVNWHLIPKHFKKVGWQHENIFKDTPMDDDTLVEFQLDEEHDKNLSDILFHENEIRRVVHNYFEKGVTMMSSLVQKLISLLWYKEPFSRIGFVLDGFPKILSDLEEMVACFCIPDLIVDLNGSSEKTLERLSNKMFKKWKMQLHDAKNEAKRKHEKERSNWFALITKQVVIQIIIDELINNIFMGMSIDNMNPEETTSVQSNVIDAHPSGSDNVDSNLFTTFNKMIGLYPEPVDHSQWEKAEDALERINTRLESISEIDDENVQMIKETLSEHKIKNVSVNGNKSATNVFKDLLPTVTHLRKRNKSFFEQTFITTCDIAESLLTEGFYLISKFNRMCPVFIFENPHVTSNLYYILKRMNKIFPVIHRSYIYFLGSVNSVQKFRKDPLKYIQSDAINSYREYPLRIGIIGPPKSGKSELASKLAKKYGLMCISRGQAIRHVLENMEWSETANKMKANLQLGKCIDSEYIMNAVHTVTIDYRAVTNGFVFDGFPDTPAEASELLKLGLYPLIVIYINSSNNTIVKNSQNEVYSLQIKRMPPFSKPFVEYRNNKWQENCSKIKEWINTDVQNLYTVCGDGESSKWQCLHDATHYIDDIIFKVNYYLLNVKSKAVPAGVMCISNELFQKRMSSFKNVCPICLHDNVLRHSGFPVDKKGVVQYGNILYWFCKDHMDLGLSEPNVYLTEDPKLPEIPVAVKAVSTALLYENGICMVTYATNLPSQKIVKGQYKFAASYAGKYYLFCNLQCLQMFLEKPHLYYDITVFKESVIFPKITLSNLPNLGYLEQTLGSILTKACCSVHVTRPKYPGLNTRLSGLLHIALYLKVNNPMISGPMLQMYEKAYRTYEARCKLIHDIGFRLRSTDNPFAKYPISCTPRKIRSEDSLLKGSFKKSPSVVSESLASSEFMET